MKLGALLGLLWTVLPLVAEVPVRTVLFPFRETVISSQVDSRLEPYAFLIGQQFKKGTVLVKLDSGRFALEYKRAQDTYEFSKASFENKKKLRERNFTSDYELKKAEFEKNMALNALNEAKLHLDHCTVTAPFDGKIQEIMTREYETVRPGQPLCRIIDDSVLLAVMNVPMDDRKLTRPGGTLRIRLSNSNVIKGVIYEVSPQADPRTGTVRIRVKINNAEGILTAGATGELCDGD